MFISTLNNYSLIVSFIVSFCNFDICECYLKTKKKIFSHFYLNISLTITYNILKIFPVKSYNLFLDFFNTEFLYFNWSKTLDTIPTERKYFLQLRWYKAVTKSNKKKPFMRCWKWKYCILLIIKIDLSSLQIHKFYWKHARAFFSFNDFWKVNPFFKLL